MMERSIGQWKRGKDAQWVVEGRETVHWRKEKNSAMAMAAAHWTSVLILILTQIPSLFLSLPFQQSQLMAHYCLCLFLPVHCLPACLPVHTLANKRKNWLWLLLGGWCCCCLLRCCCYCYDKNTSGGKGWTLFVSVCVCVCVNHSGHHRERGTLSMSPEWWQREFN